MGEDITERDNQVCFRYASRVLRSVLPQLTYGIAGDFELPLHCRLQEYIDEIAFLGNVGNECRNVSKRCKR